MDMTRRQAVAGIATAGALASLAPMIAKAQDNEAPQEWDYEYDIVVCGAGGAGVIAALKAAEAGKKVLCIDANYDLGGHAIVSGGSVRCGGGTQVQKDQGVEDSPEQYYLDHTNPVPLDSRFNDRAIVREVADNLVEAWDWMLEQGMKVSTDFPDLGLDKNYLEGGVDCETVPREIHTDATGMTNVATGKPCAGEITGAGVIRPFESKAREVSVDFMMNRHMDSLVTDEGGVAAARVKAIFWPHGPSGVARPYRGDQLAGKSNRAGTRLRRVDGTPAAFACQQQPPGPPCGQTPVGRAGSDCLSVAQTLPCSCMSAAMPRAPGRRRSGRRGGRSSGPRRRCRRRCSCRSRRCPSRRPRRGAEPWCRRT